MAVRHITFIITALVACIAFGSARADVVFDIDTQGQLDDSRVYRHIEKLTHTKQWKGAPEGFVQSADWFYEREEGAITFLSDGWFFAGQDKYMLDAEGNYHFKPDLRTIELLDANVGHPEMRIWVIGSTDWMPRPLIEGGYKAGAYLYNARQPNDYDKWRFYLESMFEWMVDRYGKEEVKRWGFGFGFESDWQTKCVYPGTQELMSPEDNLNEFLKMLDYWQAAAAKVIGKSVYVGCYYALVTQAPPYFEHWTSGTNYATGETGTRINYIGFSDWYHIGTEVQTNKKGEVWYDPETFKLSPFTEDQIGTGEAHSNAFVGGLKFKYDYLTQRIDQDFPSLKHLDIYVPESGYIQHDPKGFPAPLTFANHHGAALYALRSVAFSHFPRISMTGNNFALSVGTRGAWYEDDIKATVFHNNRIQMRMADQRLLPVEKTGLQQAGTEIRAMAVASDGDEQVYRLLATNFLNTFHKEPEHVNPENTERVRFALNNLPDVPRVRVDVYRIDEHHNNWWEDWRRYREEKGIEYASKNYGVWAKYGPKFAPYVNDVMGTLKPEDREKWLEKENDYKKREKLAISETVVIPVEDGQAVLELDIPESGVIYLEAQGGRSETLPRRDLNFSMGIPDAWQKQGDVRIQHSEDGTLLCLHPAEGAASLTLKMEGLDPDTAYRLVAETRNNSRGIRYGLRVGKAKASGIKDSNWHRLVLTGTSNSEGELELSLFAPEQPADPEDAAYYRNLLLMRQ